MLKLLSVNCKSEIISNGEIGCFRDHSPKCPKRENQNEFDLGCFKQLKH